MADLIDRQTAVSICDNAIDLWNGQLGVGALVAVRDAIKALPSAQQWIPCSKELPPCWKHVLTWWKGIIAIDCREPGYEREWLSHVEAWMSLPEPYKEGDTK